MTKEQFKIVIIEADDDLRMPEGLEAKMKLRVTYPSLVQKWTKYYTQQNTIYNLLKIKQAEMVAKLEDDYKYNKNKAYDGKLLQDAVLGDPSYCEFCRSLVEQEYYRDFLQRTLDNIKSIPFTIRDWLEYEKLMKN